MIDQHIQPADAVIVEFFNRPARDDRGARHPRASGRAPR
jgi:hypothetical protein